MNMVNCAGVLGGPPLARVLVPLGGNAMERYLPQAQTPSWLADTHARGRLLNQQSQGASEVERAKTTETTLRMKKITQKGTYAP